MCFEEVMYESAPAGTLLPGLGQGALRLTDAAGHGASGSDHGGSFYFSPPPVKDSSPWQVWGSGSPGAGAVGSPCQPLCRER